MQELRNTSNNRHRHGLRCEIAAAEIYLDKGYQWIAHRYKTPYSEIDLIFYAQEEGLILLEVKSYLLNWAESALSIPQKKRLYRARKYFESKFQIPVLLHLIVMQRGFPPIIYKSF